MILQDKLVTSVQEFIVLKNKKTVDRDSDKSQLPHTTQILCLIYNSIKRLDIFNY